jgi:uncharacterized RDD family membrane protein YckC
MCRNRLSSLNFFATIAMNSRSMTLPGTGAFVEQDQRKDVLRHHKATVLNRFIAKILDFLIVLGLGEVAPPYGFWAGLCYLLVADGFSGQSIGKRLIGLQTWVSELRASAGFKDSIIRNMPMAVGYLAWQIPYVGWLGTTVIFSIESLLIIGNDRGLRIGDELAHTQVVNENIFDMDPQA